MTNPPLSNPADDRQAQAVTAREPRSARTTEEQPNGKAPIPPIQVGHRPGRARLWSALSAGTVIFLLGGAAWYWQSTSIGQNATTTMDSTASADEMLTIEPQAISSQLDIAGTIAAGRSVAIVAPFDGVTREVRAQLGDHIEVGTVLVVMDTNEIAGRYRDAQSAYLKAAMAAQAMDKWDSSPDVLRSRRALDAAQSSLNTLEQQVAALKALLDQGIVSRNEYDGVVQQSAAQRDTVASAKDDLSATLARGNADNRQLVALDLENAQSRLQDLKTQMAGAEVATAVAGILTKPPLNANGHEPVSIEPGSNVTRGTTLFTIADTSVFTVTGSVDEVDVNSVKVDQPVTITSDAFPGKSIAGRIVSVSAEASAGRNGTNAAAFEVRASFAANDDVLRKEIRIGMSARMTVEIYSNSAALVVPPTAIVDNGTGPQVRVRRGGKDLTVPVLLGATFPQGVEILAGLKAGDQLFVGHAADLRTPTTNTLTPERIEGVTPS